MAVVLINGSLRQLSLNYQLLQAIEAMLSLPTTLLPQASIALPLYNQDLEDQAVPAAVQTLAQQLQQAQAVIWALPEYNYSISGVVKNAIDWLSRLPSRPLAKPTLLVAASPAMAGGHRGLIQAQTPLLACGATLHPEVFCLAEAYQFSTEQGLSLPPELKQRLQQLLDQFTQRWL